MAILHDPKSRCEIPKPTTNQARDPYPYAFLYPYPYPYPYP